MLLSGLAQTQRYTLPSPSTSVLSSNIWAALINNQTQNKEIIDCPHLLSFSLTEYNVFCLILIMQFRFMVYICLIQFNCIIFYTPPHTNTKCISSFLCGNQTCHDSDSLFLSVYRVLIMNDSVKRCRNQRDLSESFKQQCANWGSLSDHIRAEYSDHVRTHRCHLKSKGWPGKQEFFLLSDTFWSWILHRAKI